MTDSFERSRTGTWLYDGLLGARARGERYSRQKFTAASSLHVSIWTVSWFIGPLVGHRFNRPLRQGWLTLCCNVYMYRCSWTDLKPWNQNLKTVTVLTLSACNVDDDFRSPVRLRKIFYNDRRDVGFLSVWLGRTGRQTGKVGRKLQGIVGPSSCDMQARQQYCSKNTVICCFFFECLFIVRMRNWLVRVTADDCWKVVNFHTVMG